MAERIIVFGLDGKVALNKDTRSVAEAKVDAAERVLSGVLGALQALDEAPFREAAQWAAIGLLAANAGTAFASWPAGHRTMWNAEVQPSIDAVVALRARMKTARTAITTANTKAAADAVTF